MLQIYLTHNMRIRGASTPLRAAITKALTVENPAYKKAKRIGKRAWGIPPKLEMFIHDQGDLVTPRGFEYQLRDLLKSSGIEPDKVINRKQSEGKAVAFGGTRTGSFGATRNHSSKPSRSRTASGSPRQVAGRRSWVYAISAKKGRAAVWLTHTTDLMYQTAAKAEKLLPNVGKIGYFGDGKHDWAMGT